MQTFLPYASFTASAGVLDYKRLGNQRKECWQILNMTPNSRWYNHPAVKMWRGYEKALRQYYVAVCDEWKAQEYKQIKLPFLEKEELMPEDLPPWFGDGAFHFSHRSKLFYKAPEKYPWKGIAEVDYIWP